MAYHLRAYVAGQQYLLPDYNDLTFSSLFSDVGSLAFSYAVEGVNASLIKNEAEVAVWDESGEVPDTRAIVEMLNTERFVVEGRTYFSVKCRTLWKFLAQGAVYNDGYPTNPGKRVYSAATAGAILDGTLRKSGAMNEIQGLTWTFDAAKDSNGVAWPTSPPISMELELGTPILQFVQNLVDQGLVEMRMQGRTIVAAVPGTLGTDRSATTVLWAAQGVTEAPEETVSSGIATVAVVKGEGGRTAEYVDDTAVAKYGRRPLFVNAGGVSDEGTLRTIGRNNLLRVNDVRRSRTVQYPIRAGLPVPMRDLLPGDWISTDASSQANPVERMRVMQVSISAKVDDPEGVATLTLNDLFLDRDIQLARRLAGITGGATGNGGVPGGGSDEPDTLAPAQVIGLSVSSEAYTDRAGANLAQVSAVWSAVTQNTDGSTFDDFDHYEVAWRYANQAADTWQAPMWATSDRQSWSPVLTGRNVQVRVRAIDHNGNLGAWSETRGVFTATDNTPPPVPSTPVVTPFLGGARAYWDGKGSAGEAMPADLALVEVHASNDLRFTPTTATRVATTPVAGYTPLMDLPYDTATYVRFVAVDLAGNRSDASAATSVQAERLVEADVAQAAITRDKLAQRAVGTVQIEQGAITADSGILGSLAVLTANLANAAVNNAKIADATIQDAKIANLSVGKLVAGYLSADITVGARIATALSGSRVELNSNGLQAWSGSTQTVNISTGGNVDILGTFRSGRRNGRQLIVSANLADAGAGGANQSGMVFNSGSANTRDSQVYDTGDFLRLDSPAFNTSASGQGVTLTLGGDAIKALVSGGYEGMVLANNGSFRFGASDKFLQGNTDGSWHVGHLQDQAVFATSNRLVLRGGGNANGGDIEFFTRQDANSASGSWVDFWAHGYSATAKVFVHGVFGADSKSFIIAHPDPAKAETVMLQHSCTEGPDQGVLYDGTVTLDGSGEALVQLPDYFVHLVKGRPARVLLSVVGSPALVAATRVADGRFTIQGPPGAEVDWLVKASRGDIEVEPPRENFNLAEEMGTRVVADGVDRRGRPKYRKERALMRRVMPEFDASEIENTTQEVTR